jgi:hypothetical protein
LQQHEGVQGDLALVRACLCTNRLLRWILKPIIRCHHHKSRKK